jgi:hypothetical protein
MTAITYDYIKKSEQAGFTPAQVEVLTLSVTESATKPEIDEVKKELTTKIENAETLLEKRMDYQFDSLRSLLKWLIAVAVALIRSITTWITWVSHLAAAR